MNNNHKMKKIIILFIAVFAAIAQGYARGGATDILDKAAAKIKASNGIKSAFTISSGDMTANGVIKLKGNKFHCTMTGGHETWFNGKTLWTYYKSNEEVNVSNPTGNELAKLNPYYFISLYKKGYDVKNGKSTPMYHEFIITAKTKTAAYKKITLRLSKKDLHPVSIKAETSKTTYNVKVTSYSSDQKLADTEFAFNKKKYPEAEIIDLR